MNRNGQAMIEALIVGAFCFLALYYIFSCGIKIIQNTLNDEKYEEQYIYSQKL